MFNHIGAPHLSNLKTGTKVRTGARSRNDYTDTAVLIGARVKRDGEIWLTFRESGAKGRGVVIGVWLKPEAIVALLSASADAAVATARAAPEPDPFAALDTEEE